MPQNPGQFNTNDDIILAMDTVGIADTTDTRINPSTKEKQTDGTQKTQLVDAITGDPVAINTEGRIEIIQHPHQGFGTLHFHVEGLTAGTYRFILIDISDTTNYPHINTSNAHLDWFEIQVDADVNGDYAINLGFVENVDATAGDKYITKHWSGTKSAGNQLLESFSPFPNGWRMISSKVATHDITLNDTNYQTDVNLPSTLDPATADTPAGSGDVILEIVVNAGEINFSLDVGYHSH